MKFVFAWHVGFALLEAAAVVFSSTESGKVADNQKDILTRAFVRSKESLLHEDHDHGKALDGLEVGRKLEDPLPPPLETSSSISKSKSPKSSRAPKSCKTKAPKSGSSKAPKNFSSEDTCVEEPSRAPSQLPSNSIPPSQTPSDSSVPCNEAIVLYSNDFETPKVEWMSSANANLDSRPVNELYGTPEYPFTQSFTVETISLTTSPWADPEGVGGLYAIGMQTGQDDRLGLLIDTKGKNFISISIDITAHSIFENGSLLWNGLGPMFQLSLLDNPNNVTAESIFSSGLLLDSAELSAEPSSDPFSTLWKTGQVSLDATAATTNSVTVMLDALSSGALYSAFDNLVISASDCPF